MNIWIISDDKPGHLNQSLGLAEALKKLKPNTEISIKPALSVCALFALLFTKKIASTPDLIIAAGHRSHLTLLVYGWLYQGKTTVLMRPSWPLSWFNFCFIPEHDLDQAPDNCFLTQGAINRMKISSEQSAAKNIILIGGPSKHFIWQDEHILAQLDAVISDNRPWLLTTSRRTPESFLTKLKVKNLPHLEIIPSAETEANWLGQQLPKAKNCWVSSDSISMIFEALSAGCNLGLLELDSNKSGKMQRALGLLISNNKVTTFSSWKEHKKLAQNQQPLNEAERAANWLLSRLSS